MKSSEIRIEVVSEEEAREICRENNYKFIKVYWGRGNNSGNLMMLAEKQNEVLFQVKLIKTNEVREEKKYKYIFKAEEGFYFTGSKKGNISPYIQSNAKVFALTPKAAEEKALNMCKRNGYHWKEIRV